MRGEDALEGTRELPFNDCEIGNIEWGNYHIQSQLCYLTSYIALTIVTKNKTLLFLLVVLGFLASPVLFSFLSFLLAEKRGGKKDGSLTQTCP